MTDAVITPDFSPEFWELAERFRDKLSGIKLLATDVDGVLTAGEVIYTDSGDELKIFNAKDGQGLAMLRHAGMPLAWITGRNAKATERRAKELGVAHLYQGIKNKTKTLDELLATTGLTPSQICYIGDDTPDLPILAGVGFSACPSDAVEPVKRMCHYTTKAPGGRGAVREMTDLLMAVNFPEALQGHLILTVTAT